MGSLLKGEMGVPGEAGIDGQTSEKGERGVNGEKGSQGLSSGGSVFTRWGTSSCPSSSKLLYNGKEKQFEKPRLDICIAFQCQSFLTPAQI